MNELPKLDRELSAPPFVVGIGGLPQILPEVRGYGVIPGEHGNLIAFAEIEAAYMPEGQLIVEVDDWVYVSESITSKTKGGQSPQVEAIRAFVMQEEERVAKSTGRPSLRTNPGQLVLQLLPESYLPSRQPPDQA